MSSTPAELKGLRVRFVLPVRLSSQARRQVLLRTGFEPETDQTFVVEKFLELVPEVRARLVDVWERVTVGVELERDAGVEYPWHQGVTGARTDGYLELYRSADGSWKRYFEDGESIDLDEVFYASPGRTITAREKVETGLAGNVADALRALLAGAPLVDDLGDDATLGILHVLAAYERAFELVEWLVGAIDAGTRDPTPGFVRDPFAIRDEGVYLFADPKQEPPFRCAAVLRESSPEAYARASDLLQTMAHVPAETAAEKIDFVCSHWWSPAYAYAGDMVKVERLLAVGVRNALDDLQTLQIDEALAAAYETHRLEWVYAFGSDRLKRAAARGYRFDGIYRDERLSRELPGFVGQIGRKPRARELVNPSAEALEAEAEVLSRALSLGLRQEQVRLVYAVPGDDSDLLEGEFVRVEGYLGRHTVWMSVSGATERNDGDDIPF